MTKLDAVGASIKLQILQTAMLHSEVGAFDYFPDDNHARNRMGKKSTEYVAEVLGYFMQGRGARVPDAFTFGPTGQGRTDENKPARQLAFREKLGDQIHSLTGKKPTWAVETDGTNAIYLG